MATTSAVDVVMPQMGVSVSEGTITKWLKQEGETVAADESLLEISTDKVDTEVPSPGAGVLQQILVQEGETVEVGTKLAVIAPEGGGAAGARRRGARGRAEARRAARRRPRAEAEAPSSSEARRRAPRRRSARACSPRPQEPPRAGQRRGREDVRLPRRGADRVRARRRPEPGAGHRPRRPGDEEGHPRPSSSRRPAGTGGTRCSRGPLPRRRLRGRTCRPPPRPRPLRRRRLPQRPRRRRPRRTARAAGQPRRESFEPMTAMRAGSRSTCAARSTPPRTSRARSRWTCRRWSRSAKKLKSEYQQSYGVNPTYLAFVARAAVGDAARLPVDQRRAARRPDRHAQLRQPRLRRRARGRQGPDRPGRQERRGAQPARHGPRHRRDRRARARQEAAARRRPGRHVHDHEPRRLRHVPRHAGDQPAAGGDPRHLRRRQAPVGRPGRARRRT